MRRLRAWVRRLDGFVRRGRTERELASEIQSHLDLHAADNVRAGMSSEEARRAALVKLGPVEAIKDEYRERAGIPMLEVLLQDLRYGVRRLAKQPAFALVVILTLAVGVGANAAMFGLVDALMFRLPDRVQDPQRLVSVQGAENYVRYQALSERLRSVELAAATRVQTLSFGTGPTAIAVEAQCVTPEWLPLLGVAPQIGRTFTTADAFMGSERTVLLSHAFWSRRYSRDPGVMGSAVSMAGRSFTVIGVTPRGFNGMESRAVDAWVLVTASPEACSFSGTNLLRSERSSWLETIGRLRDGVPLAQAQSELAAIESARAPQRLSTGRVIDTTPALVLLYPSRRALTADGRLALWLTGAAAALLLLACANIAGLQSMRAVDRQREIAIRLQLGASRRRVFGQLVVEHLVLAALGGCAALAIAVWLGETFEAFFPAGGRAAVLNSRTLIVIAVLALMAGLLSGAVPALHASGAAAGQHVKSGRGVTHGRSRVRTALLVVQVALALVLIVGAGLFLRSVENFRRDFAYDLDHVITAAIDFRRSPGAQPQQIQAAFQLLLDRVRALPQVESTALSSGSILGSGGAGRVGFLRRSTAETSPDGHLLTEVTPEYFRTLGLRITGGRTFDDADRASGRPVIILNEAAAARLFPGESPVGQCVLFPIECAEVVGVAEPFRASVDARRQTDSQVFLPLAEGGMSEGVPQILLIRTRPRAADAVDAVAAALRGASPDLPYVSVRPLAELAAGQARSWLLGATVFSLFGILAVCLAAIGIYGTLAFTVRQRTTEIGVRMALGAVRSDVAGLVLRQAVLVVLAGCVIGAVAAYAASRFLGSLLFQIAPGDPATFVMAAVVIAVAALAGCFIPALRAARVDPAVALRYE